ncbi:MAG: acetate/propionate family kinase [Oscillospiraceae bacterium]|jgi:acetate kinase
MKILVINTGSSSLKYQLFDSAERKALAKGNCERIGIDGKICHTKFGTPTYKAEIRMENHSDAIKVVLELLADKDKGVLQSMSEIDAVGHRVVHGAETFSDSVLVTDKVLAALDECISLAPLHNPPNIIGINACKEVMGDVPQVAVFDTAFHQTMPPKAFLYAIPYKFYEKYKIRRYGFHGTSHRYVSSRAAELMGRSLNDLKIISCHLGNGSSVCAVDKGKSVDTSMGFTPLVGLPMGTRSGDIDPTIIQFIMEHERINVDEVMTILNKESGLLGISGLSSDFRDLSYAASEGDTRAQNAVDIFTYSVRKVVGSYAAAMHGVDALVFTGGIGENADTARQAIAEGLGFMGLQLDKDKNRGFREEGIISADYSPAKIFVIPTQEELMIALDTEQIVKNLG